MGAHNSNLKQDLVVFAPENYHILAEQNSKQTKTYKRMYEEIGVSKSMANQITNLFAINEENQFEIEAFYETTIWSVFSKVDVQSNTWIIYESVKEYSERLEKRQLGYESKVINRFDREYQLHFIWVGLPYHQIFSIFQNAMKENGLKSAMITFIAAQKKGCITLKQHTIIYEKARKNDSEATNSVRKYYVFQAESFLDDLEKFVQRIKVGASIKNDFVKNHLRQEK